MTNEEKVKAYDEALKQAKKELKICGNLDCDAARQIFRLFPELKESEDDRIRENTIRIIRQSMNGICAPLLLSIYKECITWLEKQGEQKPTDNAEPRFNVGDWVTNNCAVWRIENIHDGFYDIKGSNGYVQKNVKLKLIDTNFHLWSIQDAKDGDVLAVDGRPFIYDGSKNSVTVGAYCGFNEENIFRRTYNSVINQNIVPATKEQRDFLFQKMRELGYMWDSHDKIIICSANMESK